MERRTSFNESEINLEVQEKKPADVGCSQPALWRMLRLNKPEWHYGVLGAIGAVLAGCEFPLVALTIGQLLVTFYVPDKVYMEQQVHRYTLFFTGAIGVVVIANILQHYFFAAMGECLTKRIREMMFTGACSPPRLRRFGERKGHDDRTWLNMSSFPQFLFPVERK